MGLTYQQAGVDINAGNELVRRIRPALERTSRSELIPSFGGFAALAKVPRDYANPVIVTSTDGVGTKLELAHQFDRHRSIGFDLVGMCVNDVIVYGAEPFLFLDYFATGKLNIEIAQKVIEGIADACEFAGCALPGGETAEMPGMYDNDAYDLAGFCIGIVEQAEIVDPRNVAQGDLLIGLESNGPHSNGYSLIRKILSGRSMDDLPSDDVMEQILAPTRIYSRAALSVRRAVNGMAHITGGGFLDNIPRMLSEQLAARVELNAWSPHKCFAWMQREAQISLAELYRTFNCGIAFVFAVPPNNVDAVTSRLVQAGETPHLIGAIVQADAAVTDSQLLVSRSDWKFG